MFRTKTARTIVGFLLLVLFNFACFWSITGDAAEAIKGLLLLYFAIGGLATTWFVVDGWIRRGETDE
jgi:hypothetical protein|tara:strand:+ start:60 stop:260 length:201 start_codon:yes stop_codon:yes gene_type:complete